MKKWLCLLVLAVLLCGCAQEPAPGETLAVLVPDGQSEAIQEPIYDWSAAYGGLHSGLGSDGTFSEGTVFLGDSLTNGFVSYFLQPKELIGDAKFMAISGAPLSYFWNVNQKMGSDNANLYGHVYSPEFAGLNMEQGMLQLGQKATAIYVMLGTNGSSATTLQDYIDLTDYLLVTCPNATIYLQTIPLCLAEGVRVAAINESLYLTAEHYAVGGERRVFLLDTHALWNTSHLKSDGVHLNEQGQQVWYDFLCQHAEMYGIAE